MQWKSWTIEELERILFASFRTVWNCKSSVCLHYLLPVSNDFWLRVKRNISVTVYKTNRLKNRPQLFKTRITYSLDRSLSSGANIFHLMLLSRFLHRPIILILLSPFFLRFKWLYQLFATYSTYWIAAYPTELIQWITLYTLWTTGASFIHPYLPWRGGEGDRKLPALIPNYNLLNNAANAAKLSDFS